MNDAQTAAAMYGSPAKPAAAPAAPTANQSMADRLYGTHNPAVVPQLQPPAPKAAPFQVNQAAATPGQQTPPAPKEGDEGSPEDFNKAMAPALYDGAYTFEVPADLKHLGLVVNQQDSKEFTDLAKSIGIDNRKAQTLLEWQLRKLYGGRKR